MMVSSYIQTEVLAEVDKKLEAVGESTDSKPNSTEKNDTAESDSGTDTDSYFFS